MFSDNERRHSGFDTAESGLRLGMMLAEVWHDWFAAMSEVAYQTHRACEFIAENGGSLHREFGGLDLRSARSQAEKSDGSLDLEKLRECLQSLDPTDAARVLHAVQTMQAMDTMLKRYRSRANDPEEAAW
jgi:hypothetical protein